LAAASAVASPAVEFGAICPIKQVVRVILIVILVLIIVYALLGPFRQRSRHLA